MSGEWNVAERQVVSISTAAAPVTKMMAVAGKLWCATMNTIRVLNTASLQVEVRRQCVGVFIRSDADARPIFFF